MTAFTADRAAVGSLPRRWRPGRVFVFFALVIPLYLTWTFDHSLWNPDETRDAGIAAEMYRDGDYVVPKLNGRPFLEKPPLYYWACAAVYAVTGRVTAGTTRLPSALFGLLGILFTFLIGRRLFSEQAGLLAAGLLALSAQYFRMSHFAMMDVALAAMVAGALYFYLRGSRVGFAVFTVLAFYAKGFLGLVLPGLVVTADLLVERKPKELAKTMVAGAAVFTVMTLPWFRGLWREGGAEFLKVFVIDNHWTRFFSGSADHTEHFWFFYFLSFPVDFLPSTFAVTGAVWDAFRAPQKCVGSRSRRFVIVWLLSLFAFFTISSSKRSIYLLPLFPAAALKGGAWLDRLMAEDPSGRLRRWIFGTMIVLAGAVAASSAFLPAALDRDKTFIPVAEAVRAHGAGREVVGYNLNEMERGVFSFYLERTFTIVVSADELRALLQENESKSFLLLANRNKIPEISGLTVGMRPVFEYRPNQRTRSYLIFVTRHQGDL